MLVIEPIFFVSVQNIYLYFNKINTFSISYCFFALFFILMITHILSENVIYLEIYFSSNHKTNFE